MTDKSITVTVVRHGETEWNRTGKQQGHLDSNLTSSGIKQARLLANCLYGKKYEVIHTSSLGRAIETAALINKKLKLEIIKHDDLKERNLGILQGYTMDEFKENNPVEFERFMSGDPEYAVPGGESRKQRFSRTIDCINKIISETNFSKILIVAHGGNLDSIFRYVLGIPLDKKRNFSIFNSSLNTFKYLSGAWQLLSWGDISPLKNLKVLDDF